MEEKLATTNIYGEPLPRMFVDDFKGISPDSTFTEAFNILEDLEKFKVGGVTIYSEEDGIKINIDLKTPNRVHNIFEDKLLASLQEYIDNTIKEAKKCVKKHLDEIGDVDD